MQDLKDVTQDVHYENFRAQCISQISQHAMRERGYVYFFILIINVVIIILYHYTVNVLVLKNLNF